MAPDLSPVTRRHALKAAAGLAAGLALGQRPLWAEEGVFPHGLLSTGPITKPIPSTGERIPVVGAGGTYREGWRDPKQVQEFLSELVRAQAKALHLTLWGFEGDVGTLAAKLNIRDKLFVAVEHIDSEQQFEKYKQQLGHIDVAQGTLSPSFFRERKQAKQIRYLAAGVSGAMQFMMNPMSGWAPSDWTKDPVDILYLPHYSIVNRAAEKNLLPLAQDKGIAIMAIMPFSAGQFFKKVNAHPLPPWVAELGIKSWGQFALKYVVSHPAVVCATPGTTKVKHLIDNLGAAEGQLPDEATRRKMAAFVDNL